ncbi:hypothetical protein ACFPU1_08900 [Thalassorhabdus alkalitolerans]|uniref:Uncharacterized protein n=1 Tax=Thalassorhabdus alkalitolerans TaxID=2282697 RepID=A0ABW0YP30_9BACI
MKLFLLCSLGIVTFSMTTGLDKAHNVLLLPSVAYSDGEMVPEPLNIFYTSVKTGDIYFLEANREETTNIEFISDESVALMLKYLLSLPVKFQSTFIFDEIAERISKVKEDNVWKAELVMKQKKLYAA